MQSNGHNPRLFTIPPFANMNDFWRFCDYIGNFNHNTGLRTAPDAFFVAHIRQSDQEITRLYNSEVSSRAQTMPEEVIKFIISDGIEHVEDILKDVYSKKK